MDLSNSAVLSTSENADLILQPLLDEAVAANSAVTTTHTTGATEFRVPVIDSPASAAWTEEGEEISPSSVDLDELTITPAKVSGLVPLSTELARDSSPDAADLVGASLADALIYQLDSALFGDLDSPAPSGLGSIDPTELTSDLDDLDEILEAKAKIAMKGGTATAILAHPLDSLRLGQLKDAEGSNRSLVEDVSTVASLPVIQSQHATEGELWVVDSGATHLVVREDVEVESSSDVYFTSDRIAIRAKLRAGIGFAYPSRLVRITIDGNGDNGGS